MRIPEFCACEGPGVIDGTINVSAAGVMVEARCCQCGKPFKLHQWTPTESDLRELDKHLRTWQQHAPGCTVSRRRADALARTKKKRAKEKKD